MTKFLVTHRDICRALFDVTGELSFDELFEQAATKGTPCNFMRRVLNRYHAAEESAPRFGLVGVGCITFAQARIVTFQRRVLRLLKRNERMIGYVSMRNEDGTHYWIAEGGWEGFASDCSSWNAKRMTRTEFLAIKARERETRKRDCPDNGFFGWYNVSFHHEETLP